MYILIVNGKNTYDRQVHVFAKVDLHSCPWLLSFVCQAEIDESELYICLSSLLFKGGPQLSSFSLNPMIIPIIPFRPSLYDFTIFMEE